MPHPTPVQIAYGSVTVVSLTLLLLVAVPNASGPAAFLIAGGALAAGTAVALLVGTRGRAALAPSGPAPATASEPDSSAGPPSAGVRAESARRPAEARDHARV
ncbi:hypothetical protein SAMN06297387_12059 [Streptomyces zhaozhouensis]|uniref:Uncharacterized protein n=1 Tax=Streptomyces zhaozhouensis TaxID=1300267 RepID=A0A286E2A9_9ACTN|nr:hypothetical protein [Streptomyces zhaozhouensis]SOD65024.1 hypothetical protein SAMN06297387_12059 [Streptomyces zhaozhouensis]